MIDQEIDSKAFQEKSADGTVIDLREKHELVTGQIEGALHHPLSELDHDFLKEQSKPLLFYCSKGQRSLLAAKDFPGSFSLRGGIEAWQREELPLLSDLPQAEVNRYSRQILLAEVSLEGQKRIRESSVLLIGGGGLGSPAALYLAAAGVGRLGIVDDDLIEHSNLPRQTLYKPEQAGKSKALMAKENLASINPDTEVEAFQMRINRDNAEEIILRGWDVVLDGADNFPTRYLLNDITRKHGIPLVSASILGFQGQISSFVPSGPCYRCIWPDPPPSSWAPSCSEAGILGTVSGTLGMLQANEALKIIGEFGQPLSGQLLLIDLLDNSWNTLKVTSREDCPACQGKIEVLPDYEIFCSV